MNLRRRGLPALGLACAISSASTEAHADTKVVAEALFRDGTQLLAAGRIEAACAKLAESQKIDPALGTLFYLAACHEKQGLTASAWSEFASATEWAQRTNQPERVLLGRRHAAQLEARLSRVIISAPPIPGLELRVDDGLLSAAVLGTPIPLDPGPHAIQASAPGFRPWRTTITVPAAANTQTVTVPTLPAEAEAATEPLQSGGRDDGFEPRAGAPPALGEAAARPHATDSGMMILTWTAGSTAFASLAIGSVFGVLTFSAKDRAISECPGARCSSAGLSDITQARTYATVSTIGCAVSLAAAIGTAYLLIRGATTPSRLASILSGHAPVSVVPSASPREAGVALTARFE